MATAVGEYAAVLCRLLEAVQTNEDPSSFQNSSTGRQRLFSPENNDNSLNSSGFLLLLVKQPGTQHVKPPLLLLVLKSGLLLLLSGLPNLLKTRARVL